MHEAGIAAAVATEIRDRHLDPARVRVVVSGGHADPASFDAALRAHLRVLDPGLGLGLGSVGIVHAPVPRLCAHCTLAFEASTGDDACPSCGGPAMALPQPESIELEWASGSGVELHEDGPHHHHDHVSPGGGTPADGPDRLLARDGRPSPRSDTDGRLQA